MLELLAKLFIRDRKNTSDPDVRTAYGTLCSIYGIFLNVLMFLGKFICGFITASVSITADSFNNLGDAGSSVITLIGFRMAGKKPDLDHPFGHGRIEYISGLVVSFAIMLMGFELGRDAIGSIINPAQVNYDTLSLVILAVSVATKLYMCFYNKRIGKKISSSAMAAVATDSLGDAISTTVVFVCALVAPYLPFEIDGWAGLIVSLFIIYNGIMALKETISPLLGQAPDKEFVEKIEKLTLAHDEVSGIHDLVVHDYGPGRVMISLHAEVPSTMATMEAHDVIDNIEAELIQKLNCHAVIHLDPVDCDDEYTLSMKEITAGVVAGICCGSTIHDFRLVRGNTHCNLIFDAVLPYDSKLEKDEFKEKISFEMKKNDPKLNCVITVDRAYM